MQMDELLEFQPYHQALQTVASLSRLFSDNDTPFLHYRVAENLFCDFFQAQNLARDDSAYDALWTNNAGQKIAIGIKTFICDRQNKTEKIAEFNKDASLLNGLSPVELAHELARLRNLRIEQANDLYGTNEAIYHLVVRSQNRLRLIHADYTTIDIAHIKNVCSTKGGISFHDGQHQYSFNRSKSTLFRSFDIPTNAISLPIKILENPLSDLLKLQNISITLPSPTTTLNLSDEFFLADNEIILPLYSTRNADREVAVQSGINAWNAGGRQRSLGEVYIPIPSWIHAQLPDFFPAQGIHFELITPDDNSFSASACQQNRKALQTKDNDALAKWLLRDLLQLPEGHIATREDLIRADCDAVRITKCSNSQYKINKAPYGAFEEFWAVKKDAS